MINWELINPDNTRKRKRCDGVISFGTSAKGNATYYLSFYEQGYNKLNNPKKISLGFNETKVYVTNKTTPKMFSVTPTGKAGNINSKKVCEKIIEYLTNEKPKMNDHTMVYVDLVQQSNDKDVYEIIVHEQTDEYGFVV